MNLTEIHSPDGRILGWWKHDLRSYFREHRVIQLYIREYAAADHSMRPSEVCQARTIALKKCPVHFVNYQPREKREVLFFVCVEGEEHLKAHSSDFIPFEGEMFG